MRRAITNNAILARWRETLRSRGRDPAVIGPRGQVEWTFAEIDAEATRVAGLLSSLKPGSILAIQLGNDPAWPPLILAAMRLGLVPLPLGTHMSGEEREAALATCGAAALLTTGAAGLRIEPRDPAALPHSAAAPPPGCDFLKLTSGTTCRPRAIRFTAAQLVADCDNICETMGFGPADLNFGVIPFSHSYGFSNLITPLLCRGVPIVAAGDRMPRAILDSLAATGATVFPGMPIYFEKLAASDAPPLPRLRLCISAGAPLPARVGDSFTTRYGLKIHTFYGSSECGGIAYDPEDSPAYEEGCVGPPMRNVKVLPLETPGRIAVESQAVGDSYHPDPDPETLGSGRFIPGDLVRITDRGLYLAGRATDVINIAGRKLNPAEVEARLAQCPGVRQVVIFGVASPLRNEEAVACIAGTADSAAILRYARSVLSDWQVPRGIWLVDEIPANDRGKLSRADLARAYLRLK